MRSPHQFQQSATRSHPWANASQIGDGCHPRLARLAGMPLAFLLFWLPACFQLQQQIALLRYFQFIMPLSPVHAQLSELLIFDIHRNTIRMKPVPANATPVGMLVIYDPGFKFKYKKYYLRKGDNVIGGHPSCHIAVTGSHNIPDKVANLLVTDDLVTIEPLRPGVVHVLSNTTKKSNTMVQIGPGLSYVVEMEKDFMICGRKALMQISPLQQLLQVKGAVNEAAFNLEPSRTRPIENGNHGCIQKQMNGAEEKTTQFEATIPLEEYVFEPTVPVDEDYQFQATQKIQEDLENDLKEGQYSEPRIKEASFEGEVEMPSTIRDGSMPATIRQEPQQFAPTIQQSTSEKLQEIRKKVSNLTKSQPAYRQVQNEKAEGRCTHFHSLDQKKQKLVDSLEDLFGGISNLEQSSKTVSLASNRQQQSSLGKQMKQTNSDGVSDHAQKVQSKIGASKSGRRGRNEGVNEIHEAQAEQSQKPEMKRFGVIGKISKPDIEKMRKRGYQLLEPQQKEEQFQLLLVEGQLKWSKTLVVSLIKGKQIKPVSWVSNMQAKLGGKLQGFLWENIEKRKGRGKSILGKGRSYFIQEELRDEYETILQEAGANLVDEISKGRARSAICLIVNQKSKGGRLLFEEWKSYKNWCFCSSRMVKESVLMGEQIIDKYKLDSYSF